jgi:hypothetical protein
MNYCHLSRFSHRNWTGLKGQVSEPQAGGEDVEERGTEGSEETTKTGKAVAESLRVVFPAACGVEYLCERIYT